eukprot:3044064-Rhodomonas_salina.8
MAAPAQYSSSDEELAESFQPARTPRVQEDKSNPDLFYRLKLKLWNRCAKEPRRQETQTGVVVFLDSVNGRRACAGIG